MSFDITEIADEAHVLRKGKASWFPTTVAVSLNVLRTWFKEVASYQSLIYDKVDTVTGVNRIA
jgi:hypothetical protein